MHNARRLALSVYNGKKYQDENQKQENSDYGQHGWLLYVSDANHRDQDSGDYDQHLHLFLLHSVAAHESRQAMQVGAILVALPRFRLPAFARA